MRSNDVVTKFHFDGGGSCDTLCSVGRGTRRDHPINYYDADLRAGAPRGDMFEQSTLLHVTNTDYRWYNRVC